MKLYTFLTSFLFLSLSFYASNAQNSEFKKNYKRAFYAVNNDSIVYFANNAADNTKDLNQKAHAYMLLGLAAKNRLEHTRAMYYYNKALKLSTNEKTKASISNNIANVLFESGNVQEAQANIKRATAEYKRTGKNMFSPYLINASIKNKMAQKDSALYYYKLARAEAEKRKDKLEKLAELERCLGDLHMPTSSALALKHYWLAQSNLNEFIATGGGVLADDKAQLSAKIAQALRISKPQRAAEMLDSLCNNTVLSKLTAYTQADILQQRAAMYAASRNEKGLFSIHAKLDSILASPSARTKSAKDLSKFLEARASIERELKSIATANRQKAKNLTYLVIVLFPVFAVLCVMLYYMRKSYYIQKEQHQQHMSAARHTHEQNEDVIQMLEAAKQERSKYAEKLQRKLDRLHMKINQRIAGGILQARNEKHALEHIAKVASTSSSPLEVLRAVNAQAESLQHLNNALAAFMHRYPDFFLNVEREEEQAGVVLNNKQKKLLMLVAAQQQKTGVESADICMMLGYKESGFRTAKYNIARLFNCEDQTRFSSFLLNLLK